MRIASNPGTQTSDGHGGRGGAQSTMSVLARQPMKSHGATTGLIDESPLRETKMRHRIVAAALLLPVLAATAVLTAIAAAAAAASPPAPVAPELPRLAAGNWLNSPPLTLAALRGRPVLIEFWTFGCGNCRNTLPWVKRVHTRYAPKGLTIIAVHTPEFDREHDRGAVTDAVARLGIRYPVLIDNGYVYWRALGNQYWPAFYLIDAEGRIVDARIGELHAGARSADAFEAAIVRLLSAERPAAQDAGPIKSTDGK
jgi:thiol-disulfide isomerase/thioredoxin